MLLFLIKQFTMRSAWSLLAVLVAFPLIVFAQTGPSANQPAPAVDELQVQPTPSTRPASSNVQSQIAALREQNQQLRQQLANALAQIDQLKSQIAQSAENLNRDDLFVGESEADMIGSIRIHGGGITIIAETPTMKRCRVNYIDGIGFSWVSRRGNEINNAIIVRFVVTIEDGKITVILPAAG